MTRYYIPVDENHVLKAGDTMTGTLNANIVGNLSGAASLNVLKAGDTMTGTLNANVVGDVSGAASLNVLKTGDTMDGALGIETTSGLVTQFTVDRNLLNTTVGDRLAYIYDRATIDDGGSYSVDSASLRVRRNYSQGNGTFTDDGYVLQITQSGQDANANCIEVENNGIGKGITINQNHSTSGAVALHIVNSGVGNSITVEGTTATDLTLSKAGVLSVPAGIVGDLNGDATGNVLLTGDTMEGALNMLCSAPIIKLSMPDELYPIRVMKATTNTGMLTQNVSYTDNLWTADNTSGQSAFLGFVNGDFTVYNSIITANPRTMNLKLKVTTSGQIGLTVAGLPIAANNAGAAAVGIDVGGLYRITGDPAVVAIRTA